MSHRSLVLALGALLACLVALPKQDSTRAADPVAKAVAIPATVKSDYLLFAHLKAKDIRESALFTELKQAFTKAGGTTEWDKVKEELGQKLELGVRPTEIDSVTFCLPDVPERGGPKFVVIFATNKAINKAGAFGLKADAKPDARGFYALGRETLVHFPDDKTVAVLHPDLAQKYLDGYAKNRTAWPFTAELSKAAGAHTALVTVNPDLIPAEMRKGRDFRDFRDFDSLLAARAVTLTADLKGKELSVAGRATFADATAAGKAKHKVHTLLGFLSDIVDDFLADKTVTDLRAVLPVFKEAERALAAAKVEVDGSDVVASAALSADFKIEPLVADLVKHIRDILPRKTAANNLKWIALAFHSHASANDDKIPIHGVGPNGALLKKADEKPLLSWRVHMLPYIEQDNLYKQFKLDEPWDSDHNKKLIDKMPKIYAPVAKPGKPGYTHAQMVIGPKAMQPPFADLKSTFTDGTSNTIAIVEATDPVIWTKPDDVMFPGKELPKDFRKRFGGQFPGGFYVGLWDGSVRFVSDKVTDRTLGHALCPNDGEVLGDDW